MVGSSLHSCCDIYGVLSTSVALDQATRTPAKIELSSTETFCNLQIGGATNVGNLAVAPVGKFEYGSSTLNIFEKTSLPG